MSYLKHNQFFFLRAELGDQNKQEELKAIEG